MSPHTNDPATPLAPPPLPPRASLALRLGGWFAVVAMLAGVGYATRSQWLPVSPTSEEHEEEEAPAEKSEKVMLSEQAQKNLRLTSKPLEARTYWRTISVPGMVIDRPGYSDRGLVAPVTGVVSRIHRVAGDNVQPGETLFTLKLLSESLHQTQTDLFKATQDIKLAKSQRERLSGTSGVVPESRIIEIDNQITRLEVGVKAYRQELINRGLSSEKISEVAEGKFVSEIPIAVPTRSTDKAPLVEGLSNFEIQELKVELGQQVVAGQTLCLLANHQMLAIEGRAFRNESPLLERTVRQGWPVEIDFAEETPGDWPPLKQSFQVSYIANNIDPESRTFRFLIPLDNQSRSLVKEGKTQWLWRFRPGQRVRLQIRVEEVPNVFVVPADAIAREGAETYVFRQNGNFFERKPVQVIHQNRSEAVLANDGSIPPGIYIAQTGAAQLNRMIKSQSSTLPKGFHIHADGSVHMGSH
jgi:cobalt-zinc-cadmium efflux system membrane fusion protein